MPKEKSVQCALCDKLFSWKFQMENHMLTHTGEKPFKCTLCARSFNAVGNLARHQLVHKDNRKKYSCSQCSMLLSSKDTLTQHIRLVHEKSKYFTKLCNTCKKPFPTNTELSRHMRTHTGEKPYQCLFCDRCFSLSKNLNTHILAIHLKEKPYFCKDCPYSFSSVGSLKYHVRKVHPIGLKPQPKFQCCVCEKYLDSNTDLQNHLRVHTREKPYSCEICKRRFAWKVSYKHHSAHFHAKEKKTDILCPICEKPFRRLSKLKAHCQRHIKERPYDCLECDVSFGSNQGLRGHVLRVHRKEMNFSCGLCEKTFFLKTARDEHISAHLKETPYSCSLCSRGFPSKKGLRNHLKRHARMT
ncbi:putative zinc finger protein [Orchesella cincta]|uniref:Putative zinc finger protein n=1 Tax=Orchesella cincta TaxID=48709 RepID=A0A1D2MD23_ORCCI|nr:putative zinc finger protein [Orchesella cincta]